MKGTRRELAYGRESIHSKFSYFAGMLAMVIQFYLGFSHIGDADYAGRYFGTMCIIEGIFCAVGMFVPDLLAGRGLILYPRDRFKPIKVKFTIITFVVCLALNMVVQIVVQIPLTIRGWEMALAIVFAPPAEELFFRAFLIGIFDKISYEVKEERISKKTGIEAFKVLLSGTTFGVFSWIFTSTLFALFHVNYYNDWRLMVTVFVGGFIYSVAYWYWRDITGTMLAHFFLNIYAVIQIMGTAGFQFGL